MSSSSPDSLILLLSESAAHETQAETPTERNAVAELLLALLLPSWKNKVNEKPRRCWIAFRRKRRQVGVETLKFLVLLVIPCRVIQGDISLGWCMMRRLHLVALSV